jgi:nucleotide-binding universal stress UspA family protein
MTTATPLGMKLANTQVVGFDGSPLSEVALHRALRASEDAELPAIHVVTVAQKSKGAIVLPSGLVLSHFEALMNLRLTVGAMATEWGARSRFVRIVCHLMVGDPANCILELSEKSNADRILLGTTSQPAAAPGTVGSVAKKVAQLATCDLSLQSPINAYQERIRTDPLRLFLLLGDGFSAHGQRQGPRIATC